MSRLRFGYGPAWYGFHVYWTSHGIPSHAWGRRPASLAHGCRCGGPFGSAFYIFLQRQFYLGLPRELFEAARIDGSCYWQLFWRIAMPLSIPSFIIVFLFEFQAAWNNFQGALNYLNAESVERFTAPLGIAYAMTKYSPTAGGQGDYQYVMSPRCS